MKANNKKPSKRGMKAKMTSLHCSQKIVKLKKKIKKWTRMAVSLLRFLIILRKISIEIMHLIMLGIHFFQYLQSTL